MELSSKNKIQEYNLATHAVQYCCAIGYFSGMWQQIKQAEKHRCSNRAIWVQMEKEHIKELQLFLVGI